MIVGQPVPPNLGASRVVTRTNQVRTLGDSWTDRDTILVFVRHFACAGCSAHVAELRPRLAEIAAAGVQTILVGNGTFEQLASFVERENLEGHPLELVTDPSRAAYLAAGLEQSLVGTIGPRAAWSALTLMTRGHRQGLVQGDLTQQGGTLYIERGGTLRFYHRSARLGDNASAADVLDVALARTA